MYMPPENCPRAPYDGNGSTFHTLTTRDCHESGVLLYTSTPFALLTGPAMNHALVASVTQGK